MAQWRKAPGEFIDITIKSGDERFAPSWEMLRDYKQGQLSVEEYKKLYKNKMRASWHGHKEFWLDFIKKEEVTIACYCASGEFCHRLCLRDLLQAVCESQGVEFEYMGEV